MATSCKRRGQDRPLQPPLSEGRTKTIIGLNHTCAEVVDKGGAGARCGREASWGMRRLVIAGRLVGALEHHLGNITHRLDSCIGPEVGRQYRC